MHQSHKGAAYALVAMTIWGIAPVYFVVVGFAYPMEILSHRIFWSVPLLCLIISMIGQWGEVCRLSFREYGFLFASSICLAINWLAFIAAIAEEKIVETSIGYFINPLISIFLGWVFLKERLRYGQWIAVLFGLVGVCWELYSERLIPVFGLTLAVSFGIYGLLRKQVNLPAATGLLIECFFLLPLVLVFVYFFDASSVLRSDEQFALLMLGGVITVVPLLFFTAATTRLPLVILGVIQYLAPTLSLLVAVVIYEEVVTGARWLSLTMIWLGLLIFSGEGFYQFLLERREVSSDDLDDLSPDR